MYLCIMTTLKIFIDKHSSKSKARAFLASQLGVSEVTIRSWANGNRSPSKRFLEKIEEVTGGEVKVSHFLSKGSK